jgi:predicted metal-dependent HD superfamily phosphohydrolase
MSTGDLELRIAWQRHVATSSRTDHVAELAEITEIADRWLDSVLGRHREPHRHYHDVRHVRWVVRHVRELAADLADSDVAVGDLDAVVAAAFFHDVIYDPTASGNEAASGALAATALRELGWADEAVDHVVAMIEGTAHHRVDHATSTDTAVLFAADLGVLAADPAGYSDYVRNVRREYHHVHDADWVTGRAAVLRSFLERDAIYAPALGLDSWERRARANLAAELGALTR